MTTGCSKATDDRPNPVGEDTTSLGTIICNHIRAFISQQHYDGNSDPERTRGQLWDLASAVKNIAEQYSVDHPSLSPPSAGPAADGACSNPSFVYSASATFNQRNPKPVSSFFSAFASSPPAYTINDNNRWLSHQVYGNDFPSKITSSGSEPSTIPLHDGTCKLSDLTLSSDLSGLYSSPYSLSAANKHPSNNTSPKNQSKDRAEDGTRDGGNIETANGHGVPSIEANCARDLVATDQTSGSPSSAALESSDWVQDDEGAFFSSIFDLDPYTGSESEEINITETTSHRDNGVDDLSLARRPLKRKSLDSESNGRAPKQRRKSPLVFTDLDEISQKVLEPEEVHRILNERSLEKYHRSVMFLTRLFFAIASPHAFRQFGEACSLVRQHDGSMISFSLNDDSSLMRALDVLEVETRIRTILRRFYLVRLLDQRRRREVYHKTQRSSQIRTQHKRKDRSLKRPTPDLDDQVEKGKSNKKRRPGRADSKAFTDLLTMFFPNLQQPDKENPLTDDREYSEMHSKLKNRLNCARNWSLLQQKFCPGLLALVPCGEFQIGTDRFERIPRKLFSIFLDLLDEYRGGFLREVGSMISRNIQEVLHGQCPNLKYRFESADMTALFREPMDSERLIFLCDMKEDLGPVSPNSDHRPSSCGES